MTLQKIVLIVLQLSVFLTVFAIGLRASFHDAIYLFRRPGELFRAILAMNLLMPLFALGVISVFELSPALRIALVALSVSPIPPVLPNKMIKEGGTNAYAVGLLVAASLLAIIFVTATMEIVQRIRNVQLQMSPVAVAQVVFITVLLPIILGMALHRIAPALAERASKPISAISGIALLISMVIVWIAVGPAMWTVIGDGTVLAFAAFAVVGLLVGYLLGGPPPEHRTPLALATASRHPGIALALAQANYPEQKLAMAAVFLYLLVNAFVSIPILLLFKRHRQTVVVGQEKV